MVMTIAKITAGDGYTYLTRHTAQGDADVVNKHDAAAYYTAQGNPPGLWTGRGAPLLDLAGKQVTEAQMRALFGHGEHPEGGAVTAAYLREHVRAGMTGRQLDRVRDEALAAARLGRAFPAYKTLEEFSSRVETRLTVIREEVGRDPTAAEVKKVKVDEARRQRAAVAGFDLVFSPVKSAALLWALDDRPEVRDAVRVAHEGAVAEALALVEQHAAFTRAGAGGVAQVETGGLIAAAFEHWDSRAGDPNLHTHVAVSSKVQGTDGKWRALDARPLYAMTVAASEVYNTAFEVHLRARLGVTFTPRPDTTAGREPVREIAGVPLAMIEFYSQRRGAIEARYAELVRDYRDAHGRDPGASASYGMARQANLDTRQGKKPPRSLASKQAAWRAELEERFGAGSVTQLMKAVPSSPGAEVSAALAIAVDHEALAERVVAAVAARRSTWTVWSVRAEVERLLRAAIPSIAPGRHRELSDAVTALAVSPAYCVSCEAPSPLHEPHELRRSDGESVFTRHATGRFTSQAVLDAETRLTNAARTQTATGLSEASTAAALDGFEAVTRMSLDTGQRALVVAFACESRLVLAGIGPAGAGKTTAMRALQHVLRHGGRRLVPLATSAASADVLGRELGTRAENLHKFMHEWTRGRASSRLRSGVAVPEAFRVFRLGPGDVVLVDEAGMAGTLMLDELVQIASSRGAVVRLLGDDRQLPAVEGGGALRLVATAPGTPQLTALYRFLDPAEAAATLQLRIGDAAAIDWYAGSGRVVAGSRESMAKAAYEGWKNDMLAGKVSLIAAFDGTRVTELSARARVDRVAAGQVEQGGVQLRDGNLAGVGDWIVTRLNDRRMPLFSGRDWVKNGDAWQVVRRLEDGSLRVRHLGHRGLVTLPASYVHDQVQLLYATTAHRTQGTTVDTAHPLITEGMSREALYVLATRARERTTLYVATHDIPFDDDARVNRVRSDPRAWAAREILLNILGNETAPLSATETITTAQDEAVSLAALVPRYLHAAHQDADARYRSAAVSALGERLGHELASDPAWGAVVRRLFDAEGESWQPARLLVTVARSRELGSAESIAEVFCWRIDAFLSGTQGYPPPADAVPPSAERDTVPCAAYESSAEARERLSALVATTLSAQFADRARAEAAWPALIAALRRAENAGYSPADALTRVATARELLTARSVSEVLAWRINRHLADSELSHTHPDPVPGDGSRATPLLPWVPGPRQVEEGVEGGSLTAYLSEAADLIASRIQSLADNAVRLRPPWISALGHPPDDPSRSRDWLRHVAVVAAYRDHYKVNTDDARQVLGPYAEAGRAGHEAYWHAAESVLAARQLAGLEPSASDETDNLARAQLAADIYLGLPDAERAAVAGLVATESEGNWLGAADVAQENTAAHSVYARQLVNVLGSRGYLTVGGALPQLDLGAGAEPVEAELSRRGQRSHARAPRTGRSGSGAGARPTDATQRQFPRPTSSPTGPVPVR